MRQSHIISRLLTCWLALCLMAVTQGPARAEEPWVGGVSPRQQREAMKYFREGNRLFHDSKPVAAVREYENALKQWPHPAVHYNYARTLLSLERWVEAHDHFEKALSYGPAPLKPEEFERATHEKKRLESYLVALQVNCDEPAARVTLNGEYLFTAPGNVTRWVLPGKYVLTAKKSGYLTRTQSITSSRGERLQIDLRLVTLDETRRLTRKWWIPWSVAGSGVVVALLGGAQIWKANHEFQQFDSQIAKDCPQGCYESNVSPGLIQTRQNAQSWRRWADRSFVASGVILSLGVTLIVLNRSRTDYYQMQQDKGLSVSPLLGPAVKGVALRAAW